MALAVFLGARHFQDHWTTYITRTIKSAGIKVVPSNLSSWFFAPTCCCYIHVGHAWVGVSLKRMHQIVFCIFHNVTEFNMAERCHKKTRAVKWTICCGLFALYTASPAVYPPGSTYDTEDFLVYLRPCAWRTASAKVRCFSDRFRSKTVHATQIDWELNVAFTVFL